MITDEWVDREAFPFAPRFLTVPGGRMHYVDEGSGPAVVMVHGNPAWSFLYRHLIRRLRDGYRCVAMDHIGFGLSDKPRAWSYAPRDHARNLASLIDHLRLRDITLVVQDWGGPIGLSYAIAHPENVRALVIMNTWMWPVDRDWYYRAFSRFTGGAVGRFLIRRFNFFARVIMPGSYGRRARLTPAIHRQYLRALPEPDDRQGSWIFPREILASTDWLRELWRRRDRIAGMPTLIAWGMKDIAFREKELTTWIAAMPGAEVLRLADVGHYVQEEAGPELGDAMWRFLGRTGPSTPTATG